MDKIISDKNLLVVEQAIEKLSTTFELSNPKEILWLVFGSYVINMNTDKSDLDIIGIHDSFLDKKRCVVMHNDLPIHFTSITMNDLKDDGELRLYGAYFSGKIINPHIFLYGNEKLRNEAIYHAGKFIGSMAGYLGKLSIYDSFSASQITALVFIAYLSTDPSFDSYFLNYFISPNFQKIWEFLCRDVVAMLKISGDIEVCGDKYVFTNSFIDYKSFHVERMKISARHWSYGAICHENDRKFQDMIFNKAELKIKKIDQTGKKYSDMVFFLQQQSGLNQIFI